MKVSVSPVNINISAQTAEINTLYNTASGEYTAKVSDLIIWFVTAIFLYVLLTQKPAFKAAIIVSGFTCLWIKTENSKNYENCTQLDCIVFRI